MKQLRPIQLLLALMITAGAAAQQNSLINHVPEKSSTIIAVNLFRMGSKIPKDSLMNSPFMKMINKNDKESPVEIINKLSTGGVALANDILIAMVMDSASGLRNSGVHVLGKISDEDLFSKMAQEMFKDDSFHVYGTDHIIFMKSGTLCWNKDLFIMTSSPGAKQALQNSFFDENDTTADGKPVKTGQQLIDDLRNAQRDLCFKLLQPNSNNPFASDPRFREAMNTPGDMKIWSTGAGNPLMQQFAPLSGLSSIAGQNKKVRSSITNFENGSIVTESRAYMDPLLGDIYKNYTPQPVNTDLLKKIPGGRPMLIMSMGYNKMAAKNFKQPEQLKVIMDSLKKLIPFDWNTISDVFGSSMMMAVMVDETPAATDEKNPFGGMHFYLAMPITDKGNYDKLAAAVNKTIDSLRSSEDAGKVMKNFKPVVRATNDLFVMGFREDDVNNFINNPGTGAVPEWIQAHADHPMAMQFDFRQILELVLSSSKKGPGGSVNQVLSTFKDIVAAGGEPDNGAIKMRMEYRFTNAEQNSLLQLFNLVSVMAADRPSNTTAEDSPVLKEEDVVTTPPPPPPPAKKKTKTPVKGKTKTKQ